MDYHRHDIYLSIESETEYWFRLRSCEREPGTIEWIEHFVRERDVFYDIGANVGAYSLVASKFSHGTAEIYAFEPSFPTFTQLCNNILINNCEDNVIPLPIALSDETRLSTFNYSTLDPGGALHSVGASVDQNLQPFAPVWRQMVLCYRMDEFIEAFCLPAPNHIKLDVDGHELSILRGAEQTLSNPMLQSILVEVNEGLSSAEEIVNLLCGKGFVLQSKHQLVNTFYNLIFVRRPQVDETI